LKLDFGGDDPSDRGEIFEVENQKIILEITNGQIFKIKKSKNYFRNHQRTNF